MIKLNWLGKSPALTALLLLMVMLAGCGSIGRDSDSKQGASPEDVQKIEILDQTARELYDKATAGDYVSARSALNQMSDQMIRIEFHGITSVEGVRSLSESIVLAKRKINATGINPDEVVSSAAAVRLVTDALMHRKEPVWHQYYKVMKNDLNETDLAIQATNAKDASAGFKPFVERYRLIRPALFIHRNPSEIEKLDSLTAHIGNELAKKDVAFGSLAFPIKNLGDSLDVLFDRKEDNTAYLPLNYPDHPIWWTILMGSLIISVLTYVAWRMYATDKIFAKVPGRKEREG